MSYYDEAIANQKAEEELLHYGVLGQKWGIRRYQNKDGTLTEEGIKKYRRDNGINNFGRALFNGTIGQRLAVRKNKGYKEDKKEIKALYKEKKAEMAGDKEALKSLKSDYKKTLGEAKTTAAQVNYGWQSDAANERIQTQSSGKTILQSLLLGGYGSKKYNEIKADTEKTGLAILGGLVSDAGTYALGGILPTGEYVYRKYQYNKNESNKDKK